MNKYKMFIANLNTLIQLYSKKKLFYEHIRNQIFRTDFRKIEKKKNNKTVSLVVIEAHQR